MNSTRKIIIDGYNLIYKIPELSEYLPEHLELAREQLLVRLADYRILADQNIVIHVFFDGQGSHSYRTKHEGIQVTFTAPGEEADQAINRLLAQKNYPNNWRVVSSDNWDITAHLARKGLQTQRSEVFVREMQGVLNGTLHKVEQEQAVTEVGKPKSEASIRVAKGWLGITCPYKIAFLYINAIGEFTIRENSWPDGLNVDRNGRDISITQVSGELEPHDILFEFSGNIRVNKLDLIDTEGRSRAVRLK